MNVLVEAKLLPCHPTGRGRRQMSFSWTGQHFHVYRQDLFALLSFIWNLQNYKTASIQSERENAKGYSVVWQCIFFLWNHAFPLALVICGVSNTLVNSDKLLLFLWRFQDEDKISFGFQVIFGVRYSLLEGQNSGYFQRHCIAGGKNKGEMLRWRGVGGTWTRDWGIRSGFYT